MYIFIQCWKRAEVSALQSFDITFVISYLPTYLPPPNGVVFSSKHQQPHDFRPLGSNEGIWLYEGVFCFCFKKKNEEDDLKRLWREKWTDEGEMKDRWRRDGVKDGVSVKWLWWKKEALYANLWTCVFLKCHPGLVSKEATFFCPFVSHSFSIMILFNVVLGSIRVSIKDVEATVP